MEITMVQFRGHAYPTREVYLEGWGVCTVSVTELGFSLIGLDGCPYDAEAERVDNGIFYFVTDAEFALADNALAALILENL